MSQKICLIVTRPSVLFTFRAALIRELQRRGYEIAAISPGPLGSKDRLKAAAAGIQHHVADIAGTGMNPIRDLSSLLRLYRVLRQLKPDVVLSCMIKPALYGSCAAWLAGVPRRIALLEGLGFAFTPGASIKRLAARLAAEAMFATCLPAASRVVVLNRDDCRLLQRRPYLRKSSVHILPGIGIDLERFKHHPWPNEPITFVMVSRLLRDKGIEEYLTAGAALLQSHPEVRVVLAGGEETNPSAYSARAVATRCQEAGIEYLGHVENVPALLKQCHVLVLPSYREGFPVAVMEAMALGRAVIASDAPGCRDAIKHRSNGLLVKRGSWRDVYDAMRELAESPRLAATLGNNAAAHAAAEFDQNSRAVDLVSLLAREC